MITMMTTTMYLSINCDYINLDLTFHNSSVCGVQSDDNRRSTCVLDLMTCIWWASLLVT